MHSSDTFAIQLGITICHYLFCILNRNLYPKPLFCAILYPSQIHTFTPCIFEHYLTLLLFVCKNWLS